MATRRFVLSLVVLLPCAAGGCAAAYDSYPCGCVPYGYCAPLPPIYSQYDACPTPVAARYAQSAEVVPPPEPSPP